jgi:hypothetical protein
LKKMRVEIPTEDAIKQKQLDEKVKAYLDQNAQNSAQNVGQNISILSPDGATLNLAPRAPLTVEAIKSEVAEKRVPELDLSKFPEDQRAGIEALQKEAHRGRLVTEALQRKQQEELAQMREVIQRHLNEFLGPLAAKLEARDKLPGIQAGVNDAISRGSVVGLNAFENCIQTMAKAEESRAKAHSLLMETHEDKKKMEIQFKEMAGLVGQYKGRIEELERKLAEMNAKTSVPMYATHLERVQPIQPQQAFMPQLLSSTAAAPVQDPEEQLIRNVLQSTLRVEDVPEQNPEQLFETFSQNLIAGYRNQRRGFNI